MTGGEAYKAKLLMPKALDDAISAYLADPSKPVVLKIGDKRLDVAAAVQAHPHAVEVLARPDVTLWQMRIAVKTAILVAPVG